MNFRQITNIAEEEKFRDIEFFVDANTAKPVFISAQNKYNDEFKCMLDSGASIPVWCSGAEHLLLAFPQAELRGNLKGLLSGFGKGFEIVDVYFIPRVVISNGQQTLVLNRTYLPVVNKDSFGANLILPSSIFKNANILIAQMQSLPEKQLVLQCHSLWYTMRYTKYSLNAEVVRRLREDFNILNVSDKDAILGAEGELKDELAQLDILEVATEDFTEGNVSLEEVQPKQSRNIWEQGFVKEEKNEDNPINIEEDPIEAEILRRGAEVMRTGKVIF